MVIEVHGSMIPLSPPAGFRFHVIWKEPFPLLTLMAANTKKCAWVPASQTCGARCHRFRQPVRHLNLASQGRMELGIGRGDTPPRAGEKTHHARNLEEFVASSATWNAGKRSISMASPQNFPGPMAKFPACGSPATAQGLRTAGRIGDGVILQFADPDLNRWCSASCAKVAKEAGRDFGKIEVMAAAPVWLRDLKTGASTSAGFRPRFQSRDGPHLQIQAKNCPPR